jgi:serine/threonine-protein kinase
VDAQELKKAVEAARLVERRGETDAAIDAYIRLGMIEDAVRVAASAGRFLEAAQIALRALGRDVRAFGGLEGAERRLALRAGILLAEAGQHARAVEVFQALGETERAQDTARKAGTVLVPQRTEGEPVPRTRPAVQDLTALSRARELEGSGQLEAALSLYTSLKLHGDAGRLARRLGRPAEAARHYVAAEMPYEAALCFHEARDEGRCFEQLVRVPSHHERYRGACMQAIRIASSRDQVTFQLDRLLAEFLASEPRSDKEHEAFYAAARLYERNGQKDMALDILERLLRAVPYYRDVPALIGALRGGTRDSSRDDLIRREDAAFLKDRGIPRGAPPGGLLDDLPDLPPLPALSPPASPPASPALAPASPPTPPAALPQRRASAAATEVTFPRPQVAPAPAPPPVPPPAPAVDHEETPADAWAPGTVVAERYRIEAKLGQGGMATVYKVHDMELGESVAMKVFLPKQESQELLARFRQELLLSRQLSHTNIVRLHDIGVYRGCRFLTMELLHGRDLGSLLAKLGGPIDFLQGLRYLIQACAGLHAAHERGIVHRDVKPDNFFITAPGDVLKVMDFGIAKRRDAPALTQAGFLAGTPYYIAPEQVSNFAGVTHLADLYALGVVAFQMFTGRVPFVSDEMMALLVMHVTEAPPPPRSLNPAIPPDLEELVLRLLEKDPARRPQSCLELARSLQEVGARLRKR